MKSEDLKPAQVQRLSAILSRHCAFYYRLAARMEARGWPVTDPVYQRALRARDAVDALKTFVEDVGKNAPAPPTTSPGYSYIESENVSPGRKRARRE